MLKFKFYVTIPKNKKDTIIFEHGETFAECLHKAEIRASNMRGKITGWDEIEN